MKPADWHARFTQQARWTQDLRHYLFKRANLANAERVLEVGCGTGAILAALPTGPYLHYGLDLEHAHLDLAMRNSPDTLLSQADAHVLPFPDDYFSVTFCHFFLLWVRDPNAVVTEMVRITRPGGTILALAEPDYGGRVDFPNDLTVLGKWQTEALKSQGADPGMGRKLAGLFQQAGVESVETGVLGGQWSGPPDWEAWELEWAVLEADLNEKSPQEFMNLKALKALDRTAYQNGERVLFVPTFYAWGRVS